MIVRVDPVAARCQRRAAERKHKAEVAARPYGEVVRTLTAEFQWPCPAETLAMLVYGGLKQLTEGSVRHVDPSLAHGTTCLRHVLDVVRQARSEDFDDIKKALTVGFDMWADPPEDVDGGRT